MSEEIVIKAEGLGKKYLIGHNRDEGRPKTFREAISSNAKGVIRSAANMARLRQIVAGDQIEDFWALREVNFSVERGEALGIIGGNGAGKSTLLKVLSRITEPTEGRLEIRGRLASLLEVGTGFHPELTGRENIFLNGAILGMTRAEIRNKLEEIVDFSGVERFLDTPVKRYSSGMYVRLAFSVAAHLEPEILVVDEVLAVGDSRFQQKCLGKMQDVASRERAVIFVSHQMPAVRKLCDRTIVLKSGGVIFDGAANEGIDIYEQGGQELARSALVDRVDRQGDGRLRFRRVAVAPTTGAISLNLDSDIQITVEGTAEADLPHVNFTLVIRHLEHGTILRASTAETFVDVSVSQGDFRLICCLPGLRLMPGTYMLDLRASTPPRFEHLDYIDDASTFEILESDFYGTGKLPPDGIVIPNIEWSFPDARPHDDA